MTSFRRFQTIQMLPFQEACIPLPRCDAQSSRCVRETGEAEQFRSCKKPVGDLIPLAAGAVAAWELSGPWHTRYFLG